MATIDGTRRYVRRGLTAAAGVGAILVIAPAAANASALIYNCGSKVCMVNPDVIGSKPTTLGAGRSAGITTDGERMAWIAPSGVVTTAGHDGKWKRGTIVPTTPIGDRPMLRQLSGLKIVYSTPVKDAAGTVTGVALASFNYTDTSSASAKSPKYTGGYTAGIIGLGVASTPFGMGNWVPLTVQTVKGRSTVCSVSSTSIFICDSVYYTDDARMAYPTTNRRGTHIAFIRVTGGSDTAPTGPVMEAPTGGDGNAKVISANPNNGMVSYSYDGKALAVERLGKIYVIDIATKKERLIATGTFPQWGGKRTATKPAPTKKKKKVVPSPRPVVVGNSIPYTRGKLGVTLRCTASTACRGVYRIKSGGIVVATKAYVVGARKTASHSLAPTKAGRNRIAAAGRRLSASIVVTPKNGKAVAKSVTIRTSPAKAAVGKKGGKKPVKKGAKVIGG